MKSSKIVILLLLLAIITGCGGGGGGGGGQSPASTVPDGGNVAITAPAGPNVLTVTVNGALCSAADSFVNKACVAVTICEPGPSNCQTINDVLLDTASFGLRVFKQAFATPPQVPASSLAECIHFGDGSQVWGPVQTKSVILGGEQPVNIPMQIIDATYGTLPALCQNARQSPAEAGFNGILGVGFFAEDCGTPCETDPANGMYYDCNGMVCTPAAALITNQVQNPAAAQPQDNNGVIVQLPGTPSTGVRSATGFVLLGIGTQSNNIPSGVTPYPAGGSGTFTTVFNGVTLSGLLDTGSNGLLFPGSGVLPNCAAPNAVWFCPPSLTSLLATNRAATGTPTGNVPFQIANFSSLINSPNRVFSDAGASGANQFIWGLPFHLGRTVCVGFKDKASSLGTGPYWAY